MHQYRSQAMKSTSQFIPPSFYSIGAFTTAVLRHPAETRNKLVCVEGQRGSWNAIVKILESLQKTKYTVAYTSIEDAQVQESEAWSKGDPTAARLNLRRCMGTGNGKLDKVDNDLFPEFKATTDLESIARTELRRRGEGLF
jgi:hypothetical protein